MKFFDYRLQFANGGVEITKDDKLLYYSRRPMYVFVKTALTVIEYYDAPYETVTEQADGSVLATGVLTTPTGSRFAFTDTYEVLPQDIKVSRKVEVIEVKDDIGFASKLAFTLAASDEIRDYDCFSPANWYMDNRFAAPHVVGYETDSEYYWKRETCLTLPLFAAQTKANGETIMLSRWAADVKPRDYKHGESEHFVDPEYTVGSIGLSKPTQETISYLYYGFPVRKKIDTVADGLSIDYVYPGTDGEIGGRRQNYNVDYMMRTKTISRALHPAKVGFTHEYAVSVKLDRYDGFYTMMRGSWRHVYDRVRDRLFEVNQEKQYHNCMEMLTKLTRQYDEVSWGVPFAAFLPSFDIASVSFQFGFVGQQPGIGYQLIRYGKLENNQEAFEKGMHILDFWTSVSMTEHGAPNVCYNPAINGFEPYPFWLRMIADGMENILDGYVFLKKNGIEKPEWLAYCVKVAEWLVRIQNEDGSYYRAYNTNDGSMRMDSKANTISVVRFLIQMYLVTRDERYRATALRAGEYAYAVTYPNMEYRGSTCDNADITDNESGIYAMFGFLALYDLTGEDKWMEALLGAADYTETWTYSWAFPVKCNIGQTPLSKYSISGQSPVTIGGGGGDMYMAACAYIYYRLYVYTGDVHYRDYAEFIHNNTRQANDVEGEFGYAYPAASHEGCHFANQTLMGLNHWLPWVTYVEIDPLSRLYDTFGAYDIAGCEKMPAEERAKRNRIYDTFAQFEA